MVRVSQGGTRKWCPSCKTIRVCTAVSPSTFGLSSEQRWYREDYKDIRWFRRCLVCQTCSHEWITAELPESFLDELVELRNVLKDLKLNAEAYIKESDKASARLKKLSASLSVLRALKSYKEE